MSKKLPLHEEWLKKVEEDEFAGKEILEARLFPAPACFHFQQMAEKSLKALLVYYEKEFPKVHDLVVLATMVEPMAPKIVDHKSNLAFLNHYYIETRYPGDYPEISLHECREAQAAALNIKEFVLHCIDKK